MAWRAIKDRGSRFEMGGAPRGLEASSRAYIRRPLRHPESPIRRRNLGEPSSLFDFEEVMNNNHNQEPPPQNNNGPPPMVIPNGQAP
nr:hypothetical protein [Tanacetum cinerariifolium]